MSSGSSYSTSFRQDFKGLQRTVEKTANKAVKRATEKRLVQLSFDEAEIIPNTVKNTGTLVISVNDSNPAALDELLTSISADIAAELKQDFMSSAKEILR